MQPENWLTIAQEIRRNQMNYDSFIITHGTDTMGYTAAGLSYLLHDCMRTIVITGSQIPVSFHRTDAKKNIHDALLFARQSNLPGVFVVFDGVAIAGTRAVKIRTKSYDAFESINYPYIATIHGETLSIRSTYHRDIPRQLRVSMALCPDVFLVRIFPGLSPTFFDFLKMHARGVIIESFGNGGLPCEERNLTEKVRELTRQHIPVIITTQCLEEGQDISLYEVGKLAADAGGITAGDMNTEAIVAKLMWILGLTNDLAEIKKLIQTPIAHDLSHTVNE